MIKHTLNLYLLLLILCIINYDNVYSQAQILAPETSVDIFKTDYLLNQEHRYNPDFIRLHGIQSIRLSAGEDAGEDGSNSFFMQYNFTASGILSEKMYCQKKDWETKVLSEQNFFYDDEDNLLEIEDYYEGKLDMITYYTYIGDLLDKVHQEDAEGPSGTWWQYDWKGRRISRKVTYNSNKIRQVEYHLPSTTVPSRLDTLYSTEVRDSLVGKVCFYLYDDDRIKREMWYESGGEKYEVKRAYNRKGKLTGIKQTGGRMSDVTYKYDGNKLQSIKEKHPKSPAIQRRYTYDENDMFIMSVEVKRGGDILENLFYEYEFLK